MSTTFQALKDFSDRLGSRYGTEDFSIFMYSLIKMQRPKVTLELGTGFGVTTCWMARAVAENGSGHVWTVDNGSHWLELKDQEKIPLLPAERALDFRGYLDHLLHKFDLSGSVTLLSQDMPPYPAPDEPIDILFADFSHSPTMVLAMLVEYLPKLSPSASIFFDGASTTFDTYITLEYIISLLNTGRMPLLLGEALTEPKRRALQDRIAASRFTLIHMTETKERAQNSAAWIKIEPFDILPHPRTMMRF